MPCLLAVFDAELENVFIAGEEAEYIKLNGKEIDLTPCGYYVDKSIKKYKAGKLVAGVNEIEIKTPLTKRISVENYFLLGDFDVKLQGCKHTIEFIAFGNRVNTFGSIHNISNDYWVGPSHWYSKNYEWSYEYDPKPTGIMASPTIEVIKKYNI